jgi:hypothetical protein
MIKRTLIALAAIVATLFVAAPAQAALPICASGGICFSPVSGGLSQEGFASASAPRNSCLNMRYPNTAVRVDNESNYRWIVFTGPNCTGTAGTIYPHTDGNMSGIYLRNLESLYRTSSTTVAPAGARMVEAAMVTPAVAAAAPSSCTAVSVCGYVNVQYQTNQGYELDPVRAAGTCVVVSFRNAWSGVYNNSGRNIRLFKNTACSGTDYKTINNGSGKYQFSIQLGPTWDNSVDAYQFI